jgi:hypothetical protein
VGFGNVIILFLLCSLNETNAWIWYKEKEDSTLTDTSKYVFEGLAIPPPESLPVEENAPLVLKKLLREPTLENAKKYVAWKVAFLERIARVNELVEKANALMSVGEVKENIETYKRIQEEEAFEELKEHSIIAAILGKSIESRLLLPELEQLHFDGLFVYGFVIDTTYNAGFPIRKYRGELSFLNVHATPIIILFDTRTRKYEVITREYESAYLIKKAIIKRIIRRPK